MVAEPFKGTLKVVQGTGEGIIAIKHIQSPVRVLNRPFIPIYSPQIHPILRLSGQTLLER